MKLPPSNPYRLSSGSVIVSLDVEDGRVILPASAATWLEVVDYCQSSPLWKYDAENSVYYSTDPDLVKYPIISCRGTHEKTQQNQ